MSKWMPHAQAYMGVKEISGKENNNPRILEYFEAVGHGWVKNDETPWCAAFVGACLEEAGIKGTGSLAARSYMTWGKAVKNPKYGDIAVFWRGSKNSWTGHVAFFVKEDDKYVWVLGGNQRNSVNVSRYRKTQLLGYRRPSSMSSSRTVLGAGVAGAAATAAPVVGAVKETQETFAGLPLDWAPYVVAALALAGCALAIWARYDDLKKKGR